MSDAGDNSSPREFRSTRWSAVLEAANEASPNSRQALESLCRVYWYPIYAYVRRKGFSLHESQDLTQEFFARLLEKDVVKAADPSRGKFRSFLLGCLRNFLLNEWDKRRTDKRGGGRKALPLDFAFGNSRYANEPVSELTPERLFEREWAISLLDHVMGRLREEYVESGRRELFQHLKQFLTGRSSDSSYAEVAQQLGMTAGAAMTAGSRLRKRYRALLLEEIAHTLSDPDETDEELRSIFRTLGE